MSKSPNLAKSLHTITVLVNTAYWLHNTFTFSDDDPKKRAKAAMKQALEVLQLADKPDTYGLAKIAAEQLERKILEDRS